jgi:hypothetical protein
MVKILVIGTIEPKPGQFAARHRQIMSKQSDAKIRQGYQATPVKKICSTCKHYESDMKIAVFLGYPYTEEKEKRCGLGGFAVNKTATCNEYFALVQL